MFHRRRYEVIENDNDVAEMVDVVGFFGLVVHVRLMITGLSLIMNVKHVNDFV